MASPSGTSSGSSLLHNSGSDEDLQTLMDQKKKRRMLSNRESARRSRMRKQKHLDDLASQLSQLRKDNNQLLKALTITTQNYMAVEGDNSVLKTQVLELSNRLQSLNEIIDQIITGSINNSSSSSSSGFMDHPWSLVQVMSQSHPIMASAEMSQYL
ncbi:bZIP transcription factor 44-like [Typha angustifolia]|uniref:bZIP transcription factor 44-like n=1 Tax=Typha angustifolia TaxID=59011 RepID=UPI003C2C3882